MGGLLVLVGFGVVLVCGDLEPLQHDHGRPDPRRLRGRRRLADGDRFGHRRTRAGRDLWSRVGGFRRMLATPSSKERFDFSGRKELYTAYIPWAVAFDCADEWAAKYRTEIGRGAADAELLRRGVRRHPHRRTSSSMVGDFTSTVDGAISSYNATQIVVERRRRRRLLRRRRRRRRRRRLVVSRCRTQPHTEGACDSPARHTSRRDS